MLKFVHLSIDLRMKTNTEFKSTALSALKGNWAPAVLSTAVLLLIAALCQGPTMGFQLSHPDFNQQLTAMAAYNDMPGLMGLYGQISRWSSLSMLLTIFVMNVLMLGFANSFRRLVTEGDNRLTENTFSIAFSNYWHKVWGVLLSRIFIALWTCLFILPGIVKVFSYAMTPYILEERPELSANDAIDLSRAMMKGHKFDLFYLYLSFIGWGILSVLSCGIGLLWLIPYMQAADAAFYEEVKAEYAERAL